MKLSILKWLFFNLQKSKFQLFSFLETILIRKLSLSLYSNLIHYNIYYQ